MRRRLGLVLSHDMLIFHVGLLSLVEGSETVRVRVLYAWVMLFLVLCVRMWYRV